MLSEYPIHIDVYRDAIQFLLNRDTNPYSNKIGFEFLISQMALKDHEFTKEFTHLLIEFFSCYMISISKFFSTRNVSKSLKEHGYSNFNLLAHQKKCILDLIDRSYQSNFIDSIFVNFFSLALFHMENFESLAEFKYVILKLINTILSNFSSFYQNILFLIYD